MKPRPASISATMVDTAEMAMADCSMMNGPFDTVQRTSELHDRVAEGHWLPVPLDL
jgi:hypothetical protein